jgi:hypothetical protein
VILSLAVLLFWLIAAWVIRQWAKEWGKPTLPYFLTSLFLSPALPAFVLLLKGPEPSITEEEQIAQGKLKRCFRCTEGIRSEAAVCKFCGSEQTPAT